MPPKKAFDPNQHMMKLKGKDYLPVAARIIWFREDYPDGLICTEILELSDQRCVVKASITKIMEGGFATGYGSETPGDFKDYIEKAETKAVGRALAALGYGTLMAPELDEGTRIVDSPQQRAPQSDQQTRSAPKQPQQGNTQPPANIDRERANKRLHAVGNQHGIDHDGIRALVLAKATAEGMQISSTNEAPGAMLDATANAIEANPQKLKAWVDEQLASQQQLMPGPDDVPNPDRWTN